MNTYEICTDDIIHNINLIKEKAQHCCIFGIIKGNGYGFGAEYMASLLKSEGIAHFGVTEISDALLLRQKALVKDDILLLRSTRIQSEATLIVENNLSATIGSIESAVLLNECAKKANTKVKAHIKIDSGMGRYGFTDSEMHAHCDKLKSLEFIDFCGIYTHFSSAFTNTSLTHKQLSLFKNAVSFFEKEGFSFQFIHCANTPALFNIDAINEGMTAVRIGSGFTGRVVTRAPSGLKRVGLIKSDVIEIKSIAKGSLIGYNGAFKARRATTVAIVPVGHYDGFGIEKSFDEINFKTTLRLILSLVKRYLTRDKLCVKIGDKKYHTVGHIGLSHTAVDITGSKVNVGDKVSIDISPLLANPLLKREYI